MVHAALRMFAAVAIVLGLLLAQAAIAQQPAQPDASPPQPAAAQLPEQPSPPAFKPEELDQLLAPIALYPDELIVQILTAATYPLEIVMAARWAADPKNAVLKGDALAQALEGQSWDASVKSLVPFPSVLKMMSDKLDWTQKLGDAFLSQEADCLASVQSLRRKAAAAGTLKSTPQQNVTVAPRAAPGLPGPPAGEPITMAPVTEDQTISIAPADPQVVYVPSYDPGTAYGAWPYPSYPPYAFPPPVGYGVAAGLATGLAFGAGVAVAGSLWGWGRPNWGGGSVNINTNQFNSINRTAITGNTWQHNAVHRQGVAYRDAATRQRFGGQTAAGAAARRDYRGFEGRGAGAVAGRGGQLAGEAGRVGQAGATARAGQGRVAANRGGGQGLQGGTGGQGGRSQGLGQRADLGSSQFRGGGGRGNFAQQRSAFNPGNGAQTRAFAQRGAASRQQFAGNFQRGGGGFQRAGGGGFQRAGGGGGGGFHGGGGARGGGGGGGFRGRR
jgi:hypothetical protein